MTRVATLFQHEHLVSLMMRSQSRVNDLQTQIASGVKAQDYKGLGSDAGRLVNIENAHVRTSQFAANNKIVLSRLTRMEDVISQLGDLGSQFRTLLVNALNQDNALDLNLPVQARQMLEQAAALLNTEQAGRHLFAGTRTDTEPVDLSQLPPAYGVPSADGDSAAAFVGNSTRLVLHADDALDVSYGVTADEPGFERLIRAMDIVVKAAPGDRDALQHALDTSVQAVDDIVDIRTRVAGSMTTIESINTRHDDFLLYAENTMSDLKNVDVAEAVSRMSTAQTNLQASYMTLARLGQNSLLNFLR